MLQWSFKLLFRTKNVCFSRFKPHTTCVRISHKDSYTIKALPTFIEKNTISFYQNNLILKAKDAGYCDNRLTMTRAQRQNIILYLRFL